MKSLFDAEVVDETMGRIASLGPHSVRQWGKMNAAQAMDATGQDGTVELTAGETDAEWWIKVGDTGPGLPPKAREHLFAAFQGGARRGGTGLGLAIAAELVRGHGGKLLLNRSDALGTEFTIHLPKQNDNPALH